MHALVPSFFALAYCLRRLPVADSCAKPKPTAMGWYPHKIMPDEAPLLARASEVLKPGWCWPDQWIRARRAPGRK